MKELGTKIGFTGTQDGMTNAQKTTLFKLLRDMVDLHGMFVRKKHTKMEFLHGDCVGADEEAFAMADELGMITHAYPGHNQHGLSPKQAHTASTEVHKSEPYLKRNRMIVDRSWTLIACPFQDGEELRSGTWSTIRYARVKGRDIIIIYPDGTLVKEIG